MIKFHIYLDCIFYCSFYALIIVVLINHFKIPCAHTPILLSSIMCNKVLGQYDDKHISTRNSPQYLLLLLLLLFQKLPTKSWTNPNCGNLAQLFNLNRYTRHAEANTVHGFERIEWVLGVEGFSRRCKT